MAVAFVSSGATVTGTASSGTVAVTPSTAPTAGNAYYVAVSINNSAARTVTSVVDNATGSSSIYTKINEDTSGVRRVISLWFCPFIKAGATTVTATISGAYAEANIAVAQYSGVVGIGSEPVVVTGTSANPTVNGTGLQPDSFWVFCHSAQGTAAVSQDTATLRASRVSSGTSTTTVSTSITEDSSIVAGAAVGDVTLSASESFAAFALELFGTVPSDAYMPNIEQPLPHDMLTDVNDYGTT